MRMKNDKIWLTGCLRAAVWNNCPMLSGQTIGASSHSVLVIQLSFMTAFLLPWELGYGPFPMNSDNNRQ